MDLFDQNKVAASIASGMTRPRMAALDRQTIAVAADCSGSMTQHRAALILAVRALLGQLAQPANRDGFDAVIVAYNDIARTVVPLTRASAVQLADDDLLTLGGTNYAAALAQADQEIDAALARPEITQLRPVVVFLSDGQPNGPDFRAAAARLKTKADVVAVGFGGPATAALVDVASGPDFLAQANNMDDVRRFFAMIGASMSASKRAGKSLAASGLDPFGSRRR